MFFEFDSSRLTKESQQRLKEYAEWLMEQRERGAVIQGHCDERGTEAYNLTLGERRATAVKSYLVDLGVAAGRLSMLSYGKARSFCSDPDEASHRLNRRAHLVFDDDKEHRAKAATVMNQRVESNLLHTVERDRVRSSWHAGEQ